MEDERRILLIGGVGLVKGRVRDAGPIMVEICNELEPALREACFTRDAPFRTISLILRFGHKRCLVPEYDPVDDVHSELPVVVELEMRALRQMTRDDLKREFLIATLEALVHAARNFNLPTEMCERTLREVLSHR